MQTLTIEISLPEDLLKAIDARVGRNRRSQFFVDLAERELPSAQPARAVGEEQDESWKPDPAKRFNPIPVRGESVSQTIIVDRENRF